MKLLESILNHFDAGAVGDTTSSPLLMLPSRANDDRRGSSGERDSWKGGGEGMGGGEGEDVVKMLHFEVTSFRARC